MKLYRVFFLILAVVMSGICHAKQKVDIFTYAIPRLAWQQEGRVTGPIIDTMRLYFSTMDIDANFILQPKKRAHLSVTRFPQTCIMPLIGEQIQQGDVEQKLPIGKVPMFLYSLKNEKVKADRLERAFTIVTPSDTDSLSLNAMQLRKVFSPNIPAAFDMLVAGRGDYLVLTEPSAFSMMAVREKTIYPVYQVSSGYVWFACNKENTLPPASKFIESFRHFIKTDISFEEYEKYQMESFHTYLHGKGGAKWDALIEELNSP